MKHILTCHHFVRLPNFHRSLKANHLSCSLFMLPRKNVFNPFGAKDVLIDFTLSNARRFYSSKGNPLALKGLNFHLILNASLKLQNSAFSLVHYHFANIWNS